MNARKWIRRVFDRLFGFENRLDKQQKLRSYYRPHLEGLEDRLAPAVFIDLGDGTLFLQTKASENVSIVANAGSYSLKLTGAGTNQWAEGAGAVAGVTGTGLDTLTITKDVFSTIRIVDTDIDESITFADSGANTYTDAFEVTLTRASAGDITFDGRSTFVGADLTASTTANIVFTSDGDINAAGRTVTLQAGGGISADVSVHRNVAANTLNLTASSGTGIFPLETEVAQLNFSNSTDRVHVVNTRAGGLSVTGTSGIGSVQIEESTGDLSVGTGGIATSGGAISLRVLAANQLLDVGDSLDTTLGLTGVSPGGVIQLIADNMTLDAALAAGVGQVQLLAANGAMVQIGAGADDAPGVLGLSADELNRIANSGGVLIDSTTGDIRVIASADLTTGGIGGTLSLSSGTGNIVVNALLTTPNGATLQTNGGNITFGATGAVNAIGTTTLSAAGGSIAGHTANLTNVTTTGTLNLTASTGIGVAHALETAAGILTFTNTTNTVQIRNTRAGGVTVSGANAGNGSVTITETAGNLTVGAADLVTHSGAITLATTTADRTISSALNSNVQTTGGTPSSGGAAVTWIADRINIGGNIVAGTGLVTLAPTSDATAIRVGAASVDNTGILGLTDSELNRVSTTGGLTIGSTTNTGGITVFGSSNLTAAGGIVTLRSNTGPIDVNASLTVTGDATLQTTSGNITFGTTGGVTANGDDVLLSAAGGSIQGHITSLTNVTAATLTATASSGIGANAFLETSVGTLAFTNTTSHVQVDNGTAFTVSGTNAGTGDVNVRAFGNLTIGENDIVTKGGIVTLRALGANRSIISAADANVQTNQDSPAGADVTLIADNMSLAGSITAGSAAVTLRQTTNTTAIDLGSLAGPTSAKLELSDAELDLISAGTVRIGDASSGAIRIVGVISPASYQTLDIAGGVSFTATGGFSADVTSASVYEKIQANGPVVIDTGATLTVAAVGGFVPTATDAFTILDNTSASLTTGNFAGKPEGTNVPVGGVNKSITYVGGTGSNDVVLALPTVNLSVSAATGTEAGATVITVTATASGAVIGDQTLSLTITGAGITLGDYDLSSTTITILGGQTQGSVTFTVKDDLFNEGTETATLTISSPSVGIGLGATTTQNIAITDDDHLGIGNFTLPTTGSFTLKLNDGTLEIRNGLNLVASRLLGTDPLVINGTAGDDIFTIDYSGGNPIPVGGITFHGGAQVGPEGDSLHVVGTATLQSLIYTATSGVGGGSGKLDITDAGAVTRTVNFTGLEPLVVAPVAGVVGIVIGDGLSHTATITSLGGGINLISFDGGLENLTFANPTSRLELSADAGSDTFTFTSLDAGFNAAITINGSAGATDTVNVNTALNLTTGDRSFVVDAAIENVNLAANITAGGGINLGNAAVTIAAGAAVQLNTSPNDGALTIGGATNGTAGGAAESLTLNAGTGTLNLGAIAGAAGVADAQGLTAVTVTNAGTTNFNGAIAITGALTQTNAATGTTTFTGATSVGSATLRGTAFNVNNSLTSTGAVAVTNSGAFTKNATGTITAPGGFSTTGDVSLANNITTTNTLLSIGGALTITEAANITLSTQGVAGAGNITITGATSGTVGGGAESLTLNTGTGTLNVAAIAGAGGAAETTGLTTFTVTNAGTTNFNGSVTITGALTQTNAATGATTFTGAVSVGSATLRGTSFDVNNSFAATGAIAVTNSGTFTKGATGAITASGGFSTSGDASLANNITTTNTTLSIGGALTIAEAANITLSTQGAAGAGDITITGATSGTAAGAAESLTLNAGTGTLSVGAISGAGGVADAQGLTAVTVTNAGTTNFNGAIAITGALTQTNAATGATTFASTVSVGSATLRGTSFDVNNVFTATGAIAVTNSGTFTKNATGAITATGGFSTSGNASLASNVTTTNTTLSIGGTLTVAEGANVTLSTQGVAGAGNITITGATSGTAAGVAESLTFNVGAGTFNVAAIAGAAGIADTTGLTAVTITSAGTTNFNGEIAITGALTQTNAATGATTFTGAASVGSATLRGTAFNVNNSFAATGSVAVTNSGTFTKNATGTITASGGFSTSGDASLANNITTTNTLLSIGGALTIAEAANITLSTQGAAGAGDITITGATSGTAAGAAESLTLNAGTGTLSVGAISGAGGVASALGLATVTVTNAGTTNFNGAIAITGALTQTNAATGTTTFTGATSVGSATLRGTAFNVNNSLTSTGAVAVTNSGAFTKNATGAITAPGGFSTTGDVSLANNITTTNTLLSIGGALTIAEAANVTLSTQGSPGAGDITITGATSGAIGGVAESLSLNAGTGTLNVAAIAGAAGIAEATGLTAVTVTSAGTTNFNGAIAITGALTQTNAATGATTFASTVSVGSATLRGTAFDVNNSLTSTGPIAVTNSGTFTKNATGAIIAAGGFSTSGDVALANNITTTNTTLSIGGTLTLAQGASVELSTQGAPGVGDITITGATNGTVGGGAESLTLNAGTGTLNVAAVGSADAQGLTAVTVTNAGTTNFNGAIAFTGALTQTNAATGATTFSSTVSVGSATLRGTSFNVTNSLAATGAIAVTNSGAFTKGATGAITATGGFSTSGDVSLANNVTTTNTTLSIGGALTIAEAANITLSTQGAAGAGDITVSGATNGTAAGVAESLTFNAGAGTLNVAAISGAGGVANALGLTTVTVTNAGTANFNGALAISGNLTQSAGTGATTLSGGAVGGNLSITTDAINLTTALLTVTGTTTLTAQNAINVTAALSTDGTIALAANQDGAADQGFTQSATIQTTSTATTALVLRVNTATGGTGGAALGLLQTGATGTIQVDVSATGAGGAVTDNNGLTNNFNSRDLLLKASTGIGAGAGTAFTGGELEATVTNLDISNATSGGTYLRNTGALTVVDSALDTGVLGLVAQGGGRIEAASPFTLSSNGLIGASMALVAGDSLANDDDLTINAGAVLTLDSAAALTLTVQAGDDIVFATGSIALGNGAGPYTVNLRADNEGAGGDTDRGSVTQTDTTVSVAATTLNITAAEGIGTSAAVPFRFNADTLTTDSTGLATPASQFLHEANNVTATSINASTAQVTLVSGTFRIGTAGGAISDNTDVAVSSPAILDLNGNNDTIDGLLGNGSVTNLLAGTTATLTVGNNNAATPSFTGIISDGAATAITALTKVGAGVQVLTGASTYTGTTTVSGGTLRVTGSLSTSATSLVNLTGAVTLDGAGTGQVLRPIVITATGSSTQITNLTVNTSSNTTDGITVRAGANNVTVTSVTSTGNRNGINVEAVTGLQLTTSSFNANTRGMLTAGTVSVTTSSFNNNTLPTGDGAGINVTGGSLSLNATTTISGNTATAGAGGGINFAGGNADTTLPALTIAGNTAGTTGGAINLASSYANKLTLNGTTLGGTFANRNIAGASGGGVHLAGGTLLVQNSTRIVENRAASGGGIQVSSGTLEDLVNSVVMSNHATAGSGGGINSSSGAVTINRSTISGNTATFSGGGINFFGTTALLRNVTVSGNTAPTGGGMAVGGGTVTLENDTFARNTGGGVARIDGTVNATNSLFAESTTGSDYTGTIASGGFNLFQNITTLTGSAASDLFNQLARLTELGSYGGVTLTHALLPGSAALDRGTLLAAVTTDQRGIARPVVAGPYDIGAYESQGFRVTRTGVPTQNAPSLAAGGALAIGVPVFYVVTTVTATGELTSSNEQTIIPNAGNQSVNLSWTATTGATGYRIYRGTASGVYTNRLIATIVGAGTTTFTDTGLATGPGSPPETTVREVPVGDTKYRSLVGTAFVKSDGTTTLIFDANVLSLDGLPDLTGGALAFVTPNVAGSATATVAAALLVDQVSGAGEIVVSDPVNFKATTILLRKDGSNVFSSTFRAQAIVTAGSVASTIGTNYLLFASADTLSSTYAAGGANNTNWRLFNQVVTNITFDGQPTNTISGQAINFSSVAIPVQAAPTLAAAVVGLTANAPVFYRVTAVTASGESLPSYEMSVTPVAGNLNVNVNWTAVTGATGYRIYRTTTSGVYGATSLLANIVGGAVVTFLDTGLATVAGAPPTGTPTVKTTLKDQEGITVNRDDQAVALRAADSAGVSYADGGALISGAAAVSQNNGESTFAGLSINKSRFPSAYHVVADYTNPNGATVAVANRISSPFFVLPASLQVFGGAFAAVGQKIVTIEVQESDRGNIRLINVNVTGGAGVNLDTNQILVRAFDASGGVATSYAGYFNLASITAGVNLVNVPPQATMLLNGSGDPRLGVGEGLVNDVTSDVLGTFAVRATTSSLINDPFDGFAALDPLRPQALVVTFGDSNAIERSSAGRQRGR